MSNHSPSSPPTRTRWNAGLSVVLSTVAVLALAAMVNYIAAHRYYRYNLSATAKLNLSSLTRRLVASVTAINICL